MKRLITRLLLAFMLVWLPLQGYASEAMPFCLHQHEAASTPATVDQHAGCHEHNTQGSHDQTLSKSSANCDDCFSCHLIVQPALITFQAELGMDDSRLFQRPMNRTFSLFFPEQLQRPPLALFS